jgi:hypothetical protein
MTRAEYDAMPPALTIRELRVRVKDKTKRVRNLVIVTTLLNARTYPAKELGDLFRQRWHAEICQADCVSRYTLYQSRGAAHSGRRGAVGPGTMEPAAPQDQPRRTAMRRHIERPCPPPARTIRLALSA